MTRSDITEQELEKKGYTFDRTASCSGYHAAGSTEAMQDRNGYTYIRVYTSECIGKRKYQISHIYRKQVIK